MADVVGVVFQSGSKVYYFDPASLDLSRGERVVVQTMKGTEIGEVVDGPRVVPDEELPAPLKRVVRKANAKDLEVVEANKSLRAEAMRTCRELIAKHGLDMKLVDAEIVFGGGKITFSFYAEERVDFRGLVSDLAKALKMRIELRQIGAREEARLVGGLGPCGRDLCCATFTGNQDPVSIRMAKEQNLPLNPMKISGLCGRLMCCLKYEHEQYVCFRKEAPNRGTKVQTDLGEGVVIGFQAAKEALTLRLQDGSVLDVPMHRCSCEGVPCAPPREGDTPPGEDAGADAGNGDGGVLVGVGEPSGGGRSEPRPGRGEAQATAGRQATDPGAARPSRASAGAEAPPTPSGETAGSPPDAGDASGEGTPEGTAEGADAGRGEPGRGRGRSRRRRRRSRRPSGGGQDGGQSAGGGQSPPRGGRTGGPGGQGRGATGGQGD